MPVELIIGSVLFTHPADWSTTPDWQRAWETGITAALTGAEQRQGMRALPREQINYAISALSLEERAVLDERLDAASKSGLACCPLWGRASTLAGVFNAASDGVVTLTDTVWPWEVGDYAFFQAANPDAQNSYLYFDCLVVTVVDGAEITFAGGTNNIYPAGSPVWPVLFGKFSMEKQTAITSWHGTVKITIQELTARDQQPVGNVPAPAGPGIGGWAIGSTFVVQ